MTSATDIAPDVSDTRADLELDAVVLGSGVAGLYQLYQLREQGLRVHAYERGSDVGGTWYWNRYPGARFDSEAYIYQYLFSEDLYKNWSWSQRFPDQVEVEQWMHYVADRLDLRRDIQFSTTITSAHFDEDRGRWRIHTDRGDTIDAQFFITTKCCPPAPAGAVINPGRGQTGDHQPTGWALSARWPSNASPTRLAQGAVRRAVWSRD